VGGRQPDFIVIGAMKCATTTLHEQLSLQPGVFMSRLKEPNFFSDDDQYGRGPDWYASLFREAGPDDLCGESSTHYTKLPTYPETVARISRALPGVKLIYVMRHPVERLVSHYRHERSVGRLDGGGGLEGAVERLPELVDYGRYAMQLTPYLDAFGPDRVLPVFFDRLVEQPQAEFGRIGRFLGRPGAWRWDPGMKPLNAGAERLRHSPLRHALVSAPLLTPIRQRLVPRALYAPLKAFWRNRIDTPEVGPALEARLRRVFDDDLARLGAWLGVRLNCANFRQVARARPYDWVVLR